MRKLLTLTAAAALALAVGFGGTAKAEVFFPFDGNLVAYWPFDEGAGTTANDKAPSDSVIDNGAISGAVFDCADSAPVVFNSCSLNFDGDAGVASTKTDDDVVVVNNSTDIDLTSAVTVSAWVRPDGTQFAFARIVQKGKDSPNDIQYFLAYDSGGDQIRLRVDTTGGIVDIATTTLITADQWFHVAGTYDSVTGVGKIYVDGVEENSVDLADGSTINVTGDKLGIGRDGNVTGSTPTVHAFDGGIDEVRIYDVALTGLEVAALASAGAIVVNDDDADGSPPCRDPDFPTVQDGIDAVSDELKTVLVCPGEYAQDLTIFTDDVNLVGDDMSTSILKGVGLVTAFPIPVPNIDLQANGVKVHNLTIESPNIEDFEECSGIVLSGEDNEIFDNYFKVGTGFVCQAIQTYRDTSPEGLEDLSGLNIHDNTFTHLSPIAVLPFGHYEGIFINRQTADVLDEGDCIEGSGVTIDHNTFSGALLRAVTTERSCTEITNNRISSTAGECLGSVGLPEFPIGVQVAVFGPTPETVEDVDVSHNTIDDMCKGVILGRTDGTRFVTDTTVSHNRIDHSIMDGIRLFEMADGNTVNNNSIGHSGVDGIAIESDGNDVFRNTPHHSGDDGIDVEGDDNTINGNNSHHNADCAYENSGGSNTYGTGSDRNKAKKNGNNSTDGSCTGS